MLHYSAQVMAAQDVRFNVPLYYYVTKNKLTSLLYIELSSF